MTITVPGKTFFFEKKGKQVIMQCSLGKVLSYVPIYPDRAATVRDWSIPTDPSPSPLLYRSRALASALFRNIW